MDNNGQALILNDDCIMQIFEILALVDLANFAQTCSRLLDVARYFSSRKKLNEKIEIRESFDNILSKQEMSMVLSVIGPYVLEIEMYISDTFLWNSVKLKCKNLKSISVIEKFL